MAAPPASFFFCGGGEGSTNGLGDDSSGKGSGLVSGSGSAGSLGYPGRPAAAPYGLGLSNATPVAPGAATGIVATDASGGASSGV